MRTPEETIAEIKSQLTVATHGVSKRVEEMQTKSGIKDSIAQHWIDQLITKSRVLRDERLTEDGRLKDRRLVGDARQAVRDEIEGCVETELLKWLVQQPPHRFAQLPPDSGTFTAKVHPYSG